jgi:hypothetical protein
MLSIHEKPSRRIGHVGDLDISQVDNCSLDQVIKARVALPNR